MKPGKSISVNLSVKLTFLLVPATICCAGFASADLFQVLDTTFTPSNWSAVRGGGSANFSINATQISGLSGNGRRVILTHSSAFTFDVVNIKENISFDPSLGMITQFDWENWARTSGPGNGQRLRLAMRQGDSVYISGVVWEPPLFNNNWQRAAAVESPSSFGKFSGTGPSSLQLAPGSPLIYFGYMSSWPSFSSSAYNLDNSFYRTNVVYTPVPEPASLLILSSGILFGFVRRRRAKH